VLSFLGRHHSSATAGFRVSTNPKVPVENGASASSQVDSGENGSGSHEHTTALVDSQPKGSPVPSRTSLQIWMHRSSVFLFVLLSAVAGVLLVILPWTPEWTDNYLLLSFPWMRTFFSTGFFRGICSGLGLLDIWIGFWEALHYHERS
jgi:hypothetical protein